MEGFIVLVAHGKGADKADSFGFKWFATKDEADNYIKKITKTDSKYWTVAEISTEGEPIEVYDKEIFFAGTKDWMF